MALRYALKNISMGGDGIVCHSWWREDLSTCKVEGDKEAHWVSAQSTGDMKGIRLEKVG